MENFLGDYETDKGVRITIMRFNESLGCYVAYLHTHKGGPMTDEQYRFDGYGHCTSHPAVGQLMRARRGTEVW